MISNAYGGGQVGPAFVNSPNGIWRALEGNCIVNNVKAQRLNGPNGTAESGNLLTTGGGVSAGVITGPGVITGINLSMGSGLAGLRRDGILKMYFDEGRSTAHTEQIHLCALHKLISPIDASAFGPSHDLYQLKVGNMYLSTRSYTLQYAPWWNGTSPSQSSNGMHIRVSTPMPFQTFRMTIKGQTATDYSAVGQIWTGATWTPSVISGLQFKADCTPAVDGSSKYASNLGPLLTANTYDLHTLTGKGWLVFHSTDAVGTDTNQTQSYLERDVSVYRNGESAPSFTWSSWEDYYESAFYAMLGPWQQSNPYAIVSFATGNSGSARQGAFCAAKEFQTPLRFDSGAVVRLENQPDLADGFLTSTALVNSMLFYLMEP